MKTENKEPQPKETITPEERKELQMLYGRFDAFNDLVKEVLLNDLSLGKVIDWSNAECEKAVNRIKELSSKY